MKKLKIFALALVASLALSACNESTYPSENNSRHENSKSENNQPDDDYFQPDITIDKPTKPEIPQIEAISPSKLEYKFVNKGDYGAGIKITGINTAAEDIRFPDTIDGEPVVYISSKLSYSGNVKTLIFPDTVADCGRIPKTVEYVKLPKITLMDNFNLPSFAECSNLKEIWIPDGVKKIDDPNSRTGIFEGCSSLDGIYLPTGLTEIGENTFKGCSSLQSINLPNTVKTIGEYAFKDCSSLEYINIPESVTDIGSGAFDGCGKLKDSIDSFDGYDKLQDNGGALKIVSNRVIDCDEDVTYVEIPSGVVSIETDAFYGCKSLKSIVIPDSVKSIGESAFSGCTSLTDVNIPDGVQSIEPFTFSSCSALEEIILPDSVKSIGDGAFSHSGLKSIKMPSRLNKIGYKGSNVQRSGAFNSCSALTDIVIPEGVQVISEETFKDCTALVSVTIPNTVTKINDDAFYSCSSLKSIDIPDSVKQIGTKSVHNYKYADDTCHVFFGCTSLETVILGNGIESIGADAFSCCKSLTSITIPNNV